MKHSPHFLLGLSGESGAGKSTVARLVRERFKLPMESAHCEIRKFAAPIRAMLEVVGVEKGDEPGETAHPAFRDAAQFVGTWFRANIDRDFWVTLQAHAVAGLSAPTLVIFDDVRYGNEADLCDLVVRLVTRCRGSTLTELQRTHPSEASVNSFQPDFVLPTNEPEDAHRAADAIAGKVMAMWKGK